MPARIGLVGFLKKPEKNKTINKPQVHNAYRAEGTELYFLFLNKSIYFHLKCHIYPIFLCLHGKNCRLTFQVGDVLPAQIRACVARPGLAKCGGAKHHKGL